MSERVILEIFWDRRLVRDESGQEYEIFRGKDYDPDWQSLGHGYSKNKQGIYYYLNPCFTKHLQQIDLASFDLLAANDSERHIYFKDKHAVYLNSIWIGFAPLPQADPHNFTVIDLDKAYARSGNIDYWLDSQLPYSLTEMTSLNQSYQRVGDTIYFGHTNPVPCDAATFEQVHPKVTTLFKDKDHLYFKGKIVEGANPQTFYFLPACIGEDAPHYLECDIHFYARDDQYAYFVNAPHEIKIIRTKDLANFRFEVSKGIGYGRDSKYRYEKGRRRKISP